MTILAANVWFLVQYLHRCIEAHFQQLSLQCSNGTMCLLIVIISVCSEGYLMIRKPLCNHVHTSEDFLACYRSYKTDLPLSRLSFWSITFVGSIKRSKWPEKENFHLKLDSLFLFLEMKAIPCEKLLRNWRFPTTVCTTFRGQPPLHCRCWHWCFAGTI